MDSQVEEIRNKLNVVDVVGSYIKLTKTGINYRGVCPFHKEKSPSFFVSPTRQMWHCFGCGLGHSIFDFVMKIEGIEFGDALRILAKKAGVELKRENVQLKTERQRLYEICDLSCAFFEKQLEASVIGKEAKEYLLKRGIRQESIEKWRLGYSPDTWNSLTDYLVGKGYSRQEIVKAGLAVEKEGKNDSYDRFRGRIIFPIFDTNSQVVGFGARVFSARGGSASGGKTANEKEVAKYINTPQTFLYDKSNILYGLNFARIFARKNNQITLTEGYTDTIMCHQAGFENTVATSGTALTQQHLAILKRYTDNLILAFDMDLAGSNAISRGIDLAISQGFNIKIISAYSGAKDPAEIILEDPGIWESSLKDAREIMDFSFDSAFSNFDKNTSQGRKEIESVIFPRIIINPNIIEQAKQRQKLSQKFGVREEDIIESMNKWKLKNSNKIAKGFDNQVSIIKNISTIDNRKLMIEDKIISMIFKNPGNINLIEEKYFQFFSDNTKNLLEKIKNKEISNDPIVKDFKETMALKAEVNYQEEAEEEIPLCLLELKTLELKNKLNKITSNIRYAESDGNHEEVKKLMAEFNSVSREL